MTTTKVKIRNTNELKEVSIIENGSNIIKGKVKESWQEIINEITELLGVSAGLIMEITKESMQVFLMSQNEKNPYSVGGNDYLCHGLYCETVIGNDKELLIKNALENKVWEDNPDVKLDMIGYYGLPIHYPTGESFGTICILDNKTIKINENQKKIIRLLRDSLEKDLMILNK